MDKVVNISFKDSENWVSVSGQYNIWLDYAQTNKDGIINARWLAPEKIKGIWNGSDIDIQHRRWNAYSLTIILRESEISNFSKIQSATDIVISDSNGIIHTVDLSNSDYFEVTEPERLGITTNYRITINYRTELTIIDYGKRDGGVSKIKVYDYDTLNYFEIPFKFEPYLNSLEPVKKVTTNDDGKEAITNSLVRTQLKCLLFAGLTDTNKLKKYAANDESIEVINGYTYTPQSGTLSYINDGSFTIYFSVAQIGLIPGDELKTASGKILPILTVAMDFLSAEMEFTYGFDFTEAFYKKTNTGYNFLEAPEVIVSQLKNELFQIEINGIIATANRYPKDTI